MRISRELIRAPPAVPSLIVRDASFRGGGGRKLAAAREAMDYRGSAIYIRSTGSPTLFVWVLGANY